MKHKVYISVGTKKLALTVNAKSAESAERLARHLITIDGVKSMPDEQVFRCDDIMDFMRGFGK